MIAPDEKTFEYLRGRERAPQGAAYDEAVARWRELYSDADAVFDREYRFDALYDKLAFIGQRATLFSGSIRENVFFGQSAGDDTDADLQTALELAQASEFVSRLDKGVAYPV
ncbi:MAG: hypothetical protein KIC63_11475, partial [Clostridium sp.]|nr:hypothetical protein [Clostridium sp.]